MLSTVVLKSRKPLRLQASGVEGDALFVSGMPERTPQTVDVAHDAR